VPSRPRGADVALTARRADRLDEVAQELCGIGVRSVGVACDVVERAQIERALAEVEAQLGPIDILVNNAGVAPTGRAEQYSEEKWRSAIDVNLNAVFSFCQLVGSA